MEVKIEINCVKCKSKKLVKDGKSKSGVQRYVCKDCQKTQQIDFKRNGDKPEVKEKIKKMAHNGNGIRQTSRILEISTTTVMRVLKKNKLWRNKS